MQRWNYRDFKRSSKDLFSSVKYGMSKLCCLLTFKNVHCASVEVDISSAVMRIYYTVLIFEEAVG